MRSQVTELAAAPNREHLARVRNAPAPPRNADILAWIKAGLYCGNKPSGGLWTSTYTPDDDYLSDWQRGRDTNAAIQAAYPDDARLVPYVLEVDASARVLQVDSLDEAVAFTRDYRLARFEIPGALRSGPGVLLTGEITDWERVFRSFGAVNLSVRAADEIVSAMLVDEVTTAFHTWHCESTLWARWLFTGVRQVEIGL